MVCNAPTAGFHLLTVQCGPAAPIRLGATLMDVARFHLLTVQCGPAAPIRLGATLMDVARFHLLAVQCGPAAPIRLGATLMDVARFRLLTVQYGPEARAPKSSRQVQIIQFAGRHKQITEHGSRTQVVGAYSNTLSNVCTTIILSVPTIFPRIQLHASSGFSA